MSVTAFDRRLWLTSKKPPDSANTRMVETSSATLRIRDTNTNQAPLVFLCDPPVTVEAYDELVVLLGESYRVIVIELPGFGFSSAKNNSALKFQRTVEAIESAIQQMCDRPVVLFGPCICGFVAAEISRRSILSIAGIVLMQTPDVPGMLKWREGVDSKKLLRAPYLGQLLVRAKAKSLTSFWLKYATAKDFNHSKLTQVTLSALDEGASYQLATMFQLWGKGPKSEQVPHPALIVWGKQDRSHSSTDPKVSLKHSRDAEIIELNHCGHFSELEDPEGFVRAVTPFLNTINIEV